MKSWNKIILAVAVSLTACTRPERGTEFLGLWQAVHTTARLAVNKSGEFYVLDDGTLKLNAIYEDGALRVSSPTGTVLVTHNKEKDTLIFFDEYKRTKERPFNHREVATTILWDLKLLDSAINQWALEQNKTSGDRPTPLDLRKFVKEGSRLYKTLSDPAGPKDPLGNPYGPFAVDELPKVNFATFETLSDVAPYSFWHPFIEKQ